MAHVVKLANGYEISDERTRLDMEFVLDALDGTYWAKGRPRDVTLRSWANCLAFGIYAPGDAPCGFGRLLTDYAIRGHLGDVFILPEARGMGLGKALVTHILAHPALQSVSNWTLTTSDAHGLYERFGFRVVDNDGRWMTFDRPGGPGLEPP